MIAWWLALSMCIASDARALCCPSACSVRDSSHWVHADAVLRACMRGLGCVGADRVTVAHACECAR